MPSHLHLIISAVNNNFSEIIRDFKKFTSQKILKLLKKTARRAEEIGFYGYLEKQVKTMNLIQLINFGNRITTQ